MFYHHFGFYKENDSIMYKYCAFFSEKLYLIIQFSLTEKNYYEFLTMQFMIQQIPSLKPKGLCDLTRHDLE